MKSIQVKDKDGIWIHLMKDKILSYRKSTNIEDILYSEYNIVVYDVCGNKYIYHGADSAEDFERELDK